MSRRDDELLQVLLEQGTAAARQRAGDDAAAQERLRDLAYFVERCRTEFAEPSDARLVASILQRTTRQDPSWRGDLALLGRFVRETLSRSALARAAAVLLLVPLLGAPVLGWMVLRAALRPEGFSTRIEFRQVEPFLPAAPESPQGEVEFPWDGEALAEIPQSRTTVVVGVPGEARAAEARAAAAQILRGAVWPRLPEDGPFTESWARRARAEVAGPPVLARNEADLALVGALEVERLLDLWALQGHAPDGLGVALDRLGRQAQAPLDVRRLEGLALDRARAYGLVDSEAWGRLAGSGARPGERSPHDPLDRHWRANLAAALEHSSDGRELLAEHDFQAWLARR